MPPATGAVRFCLHRSLIFTEPLLGCVELPLHELTQDGLCTQWHPLRAKGAAGSSEILGEVRAPRRAPPRAVLMRARAAHAGVALDPALPRQQLGEPGRALAD